LPKKLDIDELALYARKFGLGSPTQSSFAENAGLVPDRAWKWATKGERWWLGETFSAIIGQSYLLATPLQIARMFAAIETGYLTTPRITADAPVTYEPLTIKQETRSFLKRVMRLVVTKGTARTLSYLKDFTIYAKTSTAQMSNLSKKELGKEYLEHGWLALNFSYKNHKPLTLVIVVEHAGSAQPSVLTARSFLKGYRQLVDSHSISEEQEAHIPEFEEEDFTEEETP